MFLESKVSGSSVNNCISNNKTNGDARKCVLDITMVLILNCNSDTGAHVWSNLCYLIESSHKLDFFLSKRPIACETCSELPSNMSTMVTTASYLCRYCRVLINFCKCYCNRGMYFRQRPFILQSQSHPPAKSFVLCGVSLLFILH